MKIKSFNVCPHCKEELEELEWIVVCQKCKIYFELKEYSLSPLDSIIVKGELEKKEIWRKINEKKQRLGR